MVRILAFQSGACSGIDNMALDEALLEWVRVQEEPLLLLRTYGWDAPTLSLGVHQPVKDLHFLLQLYGTPPVEVSGQAETAVVRRPTGGRAILHGQDISFAFITNEPGVLKKTLKEAYASYAGVVQDALSALAVETQVAQSAGSRDYLRSPVCFQTSTPSDLLAPAGQKISGSAQLRRSGGLLQHGAAFLTSYGIEEPAFFQALCQVAQSTFQCPLVLLSLDEARNLVSDWPFWQALYRKSSSEIWEKASTTNGSHLLPASC